MLISAFALCVPQAMWNIPAVFQEFLCDVGVMNSFFLSFSSSFPLVIFASSQLFCLSVYIQQNCSDCREKDPLLMHGQWMRVLRREKGVLQ